MKNAVVANTSKMKDALRSSYGLIQALGVLLILIVVISILSPRFLSWINITNLMAQMPPTLIIAAGMTIVMISGEFDISVGSVMGMTACLCAVLIHKIGTVPAIILSLLVGPALSAFSALVILKGRIPSFITTLGMLMIARSLAFVVTGGDTIANLPEAFKVVGRGKIIGISVPFLIAMTWFAAGWVLMSRTALGKQIYAVGANRTVAMLSGIKVNLVKFYCLLIVGLSSSFAGVLLLSRIGAIQADTGRGLEFEVIAAVVIGGTSLYGGEGNILRTIIGVFIIILVRNFLNLSRIDVFWQDFATGGIIISAVLLDAIQKRIGQERR